MIKVYFGLSVALVCHSVAVLGVEASDVKAICIPIYVDKFLLNSSVLVQLSQIL